MRRLRSWKVRVGLLVAITAGVVGTAAVATGAGAGDTGTKVYWGGAKPGSTGAELQVGSFVAQWTKDPATGRCVNKQGAAGGVTAADEPGAGGEVQLKVDLNCRVTVASITVYGPANPPKDDRRPEGRSYYTDTTSAP